MLVTTGCVWVSEWVRGLRGQRKANIFLAVVRPANRVCIFIEERFSNDVSFRSNVFGEHGMFTSNNCDRVEDINSQKEVTSGHSQYICKKVPTWPREHRSQLGECMRFMWNLFLVLSKLSQTVNQLISSLGRPRFFAHTWWTARGPLDGSSKTE